MAYSPKRLPKIADNMLLSLLITLMLTSTAQAASRAQLRFLSFIIRDQAPTSDEAKTFRSGERSITSFIDEWLDSEAHKQRVRRYFTDMFGVASDHEMVSTAFLLRTIKGGDIYFRGGRNSAPCSGDQAVPTEAWWLPAGTTIKVCPKDLSQTLTADVDGKKIPCTSDVTMSVKGCGCGPKLIACFPELLTDQLNQEVRTEFANQAALAYDRGGTWLDTLASDQFYGTRLLYWKYLHTAKMARGGVLPSSFEMQKLGQLSMYEWRLADYPGTAIRSGLVTSPGFLMQQNNFRVRVRALSEKLLCQSISPTLNTSGISTFLNPTFTKEDLSHADKEGCSRCHYPMDNLGSLLFGWDTRGEWLGYAKDISQYGHAFGEDGKGPRFLIRSLIERGPGFVECMARTAWEDFASSKWDELPTADKQSLISLAALGPKSLIRTMLRSTLLANLGIESDSPPPPTASAIPWTDVAPVFSASCSGSSCHTSGSFNTTYVDHEKNVVTHAATIVTRITTKEAGMMPPKTASRKLTDDEIALIKKFLGK